MTAGYAAVLNGALDARRAGRPAEAKAGFERAIALDPQQPAAHFYLGCAHLIDLRHDLAASCFERAAVLAPGVVETLANLGLCRHALGQLDAAADAFRRAIALAPGRAEPHGNLALVLQDLGRPAEAEASLRRALALKPQAADLHSNLGTVLRDLGRLDDAIAAFERALALDPDSVMALSNLGPAKAVRGDFDAPAEIARYRRAVALEPDNAAAHQDLLMVLNYDEALATDDLAALHREFGRVHDRPPATIAPHPNDRDPERRLRIGYVSADLGAHPVGYFVHGALAAHDRERFEVHLYDCGARDDWLAAALRRHADRWRPVRGLNPDALAAQIRSDAIDILVDLAGHTGGNRLTTFARKPAPVQASWIGYFFTTGLAAMDYALTDGVTVPPGGERWFTETVIRLPDCRFSYTPPPYAPAPSAAPATRNGFVTFGSFNSVDKLSPRVIAAWARIVGAAPGARLLLKWKTLAHQAERDRIAAQFAAAGLTGDRLELRAASPHAAMLQEYGEVDIALDPFPFSGGLTSIEALWMGVPVVTLPGERPNSRQTLAFLKVIGAAELAAASLEDYVARAGALAGDRPRLAALRGTLRGRIAASPLLDHAAFAGHVDAAFRTMWRQYCGAAAGGRPANKF